MPTISCVRDQLFAAIGKTFSDHEFDELCFEFGIELDDIVTEPATNAAGQKEDLITYKIEIPANRYDILCIEGLSTALRVFLELMPTPLFRLAEPAGGRQQMLVKTSTHPLRPYVACAVLRGVTFDQTRYDSFIGLQEKLHQNICRRRTLVAIGTHDLSTLQGPFTYTCETPTDISFVPLTESTRAFNAKELLDHYRTDIASKHLKPYTDIIYDAPTYPVIRDANGTVLSLPPIINSNHSKITLTTRDIFIECTGTDLAKVNIVLDTMVTMFSQYCAEAFTVEPVDVTYQHQGVSASAPLASPSSSTSSASSPDGPLSSSSSKRVAGMVYEHEVTPRLSTRRETATLKDIRGIVGVPLSGEEVCRLCNKMQLGPAEYIPAPPQAQSSSSSTSSDEEDLGSVVVTVPATRSDVLHAVDVIEDIAIAYGFNKVPTKMPSTLSVGKPLPINHFSDLLRDEIARGGYVEMLTHGLCSRAENFTMLRRPDRANPTPSTSSSVPAEVPVHDAVVLSNPANVEYQVVRTTLIPGALKVLNYNKSMSFTAGVKLFEISDVVLLTDNDVGCKNARRLVALYAGPTAGFEIIHGLVDRIMALCQIAPLREYAQHSMTSSSLDSLDKIAAKTCKYRISPSPSPEVCTDAATFFPGRAADIVLVEDGGAARSTTVVGRFGVLHPEVLKAYEIPYPCSVVELDLEPLM